MNELMQPLKTYDWGGDRGSLASIDTAIREAHGDAAALAEIEEGLIETLHPDTPLPAKEFACRKLALIGTARCVPALAAMLPDPEQADRALFALQAIPDAAAGGALRDALPSAAGVPRIGIVNALGERRDNEAVPALLALAKDADATLSGAVASALRKIESS